MRRLIKSLTPDARHRYWRWVGGVFAFYVALMVTAAGVFISHESARKLAHEPATTVAMDGKLLGSSQASLPQAARF
jgi:divalent metal cation (Fe/Co/Zn/Cd) transporter